MRTNHRRVRPLLPVTMLACVAALLLVSAKHVNGYPVEKKFPQETHNPLQQWAAEAASEAHSPANGISLQINTTVLKSSGDWVEVKWSGVPYPSYDDLIAVYVPANASITATAPAKFKFVARADPGHMQEGAGSTRFRMLNMRADMRFVFVRGGPVAPQIVASSEVLQLLHPNEPTGVHLALTGNPSEMLVQWVTRDAGTPYVTWGTSPGKHDAGSSSGLPPLTYTRQDVCGAPANGIGYMDPGVMQRAVMSGLQSGQRYYYVVGDKDADTWSAEFSFVAPPAPGPHSSASFFAIADLGQTDVDGSNEGIEMVSSLPTTRLMAQPEHAQGRGLIVHNGDIAYGLGFVATWDTYFDQIQPLAASMPYMTTPGNHERNWPGTGDLFDGTGAMVTDSFGECGVPYERRLTMPTPGTDQMWYSFDYGPVHFLQYSTEHPFGPGTPQHDFILRDLAAVNRSVTPWLLVGGHRPFYIDSLDRRIPDGDQDVAAALRASLESAFLEAGVDLTLHGHHHSYQRTCPMYNGTCVEAREDGSHAAPMHLVIGHAGAGLCYNILPDKPRFWEVVKVEHGFAKMDANMTHLAVQVILSADGSVMDEFVMTKGVSLAEGASLHPHASAPLLSAS